MPTGAMEEILARELKIEALFGELSTMEARIFAEHRAMRAELDRIDQLKAARNARRRAVAAERRAAGRNVVAIAA